MESYIWTWAYDRRLAEESILDKSFLQATADICKVLHNIISSQPSSLISTSLNRVSQFCSELVASLAPQVTAEIIEKRKRKDKKLRSPLTMTD